MVGLSRWRYLWLGWGATFVAIQAAAIAKGDEDSTLSAQVWWIAGVEPGKPCRWQARRIAVASGLIWLGLHWVFGMFAWEFNLAKRRERESHDTTTLAVGPGNLRLVRDRHPRLRGHRG